MFVSITSLKAIVLENYKRLTELSRCFKWKINNYNRETNSLIALEVEKRNKNNEHCFST